MLSSLFLCDHSQMLSVGPPPPQTLRGRSESLEGKTTTVLECDVKAADSSENSVLTIETPDERAL